MKEQLEQLEKDIELHRQSEEYFFNLLLEAQNASKYQRRQS